MKYIDMKNIQTEEERQKQIDKWDRQIQSNMESKKAERTGKYREKKETFAETEKQRELQIQICEASVNMICRETHRKSFLAAQDKRSL